MDFEYLRKNAASNLATLSNLAWSPAVPLSVGIEVKDLTNYSTLVWTAPEGKTPFGYQILIRETSASHWEKQFWKGHQGNYSFFERQLFLCRTIRR